MIPINDYQNYVNLITFMVSRNYALDRDYYVDVDIYMSKTIQVILTENTKHLEVYLIMRFS